MQTRHSDILKINKGYSKRYMKSAIPSMQRILNKDKQKQLEALDKTDLKSLCVTNKLCLLGYIVVTINFIIIIIIIFEYHPISHSSLIITLLPGHHIVRHPTYAPSPI